MSSKPIILIGAGGHASVLLDMLMGLERPILAYVSPSPAVNERMFADIKWLRSDELVWQHYKSEDVELVNGIGSLPRDCLRAQIFTTFKERAFAFATIVAKNATVSAFAELGEGVQVMPGAIINAGSRIGMNTIVNTKAGIDHDCNIGMHNHVAPGVTLCGGVTTGQSVYLGTGANVIHGISIGDSSIIGAGATVTKTVGEETLIFPAKTSQGSVQSKYNEGN